MVDYVFCKDIMVQHEEQGQRHLYERYFQCHVELIAIYSSGTAASATSVRERAWQHYQPCIHRPMGISNQGWVYRNHKINKQSSNRKVYKA